MSEKIGRLEKGYAADIAVLNIKDVKNLPIHNPVDTVINYLDGDNVTDVIVNGKLVIENGKVKTLDGEKITEELLNWEEEIKEKFSELAKQLKTSHNI